MKKVIKKRSLEERKLFFARNLYKVKLESLPKKVETKKVEMEKEEIKKVTQNVTKLKSKTTVQSNK